MHGGFPRGGTLGSKCRQGSDGCASLGSSAGSTTSPLGSSPLSWSSGSGSGSSATFAEARAGRFSGQTEFRARPLRRSGSSGALSASSMLSAGGGLYTSGSSPSLNTRSKLEHMKTFGEMLYANQNRPPVPGWSSSRVSPSSPSVGGQRRSASRGSTPRRGGGFVDAWARMPTGVNASSGAFHQIGSSSLSTFGEALYAIKTRAQGAASRRNHMTFTQNLGEDMGARCRPRSASPRMWGGRATTLQDFNGDQWPTAPANLQTYGEVLHANVTRGLTGGASSRRQLMSFSDHRRDPYPSYSSPNDLLTTTERFTASTAALRFTPGTPGRGRPGSRPRSAADSARGGQKWRAMRLSGTFVGGEEGPSRSSTWSSARLRARSS
mmetsp:Transcript_46089/g.148079  ORF Transcript_46089/g.148079 Transcript_46089/m.148079 type:complete len:380 (+) Transcript_46089:242-1381(+)